MNPVRYLAVVSLFTLACAGYLNAQETIPIASNQTATPLLQNSIVKVAGGFAFSSMTLDSAGHPVIAYVDGNNNLKLAYCGDQLCRSGNTLVAVDHSHAMFMPSLVRKSNKPIISYAYGNLDQFLTALRLAFCGNPACTAGNKLITLDGSGPDQEGWGSSLQLDGAGNPVVSYSGNHGTKLLHCGNLTCTSGNSFATLDPLATWTETSLRLDLAGNPVVAYEAATPGVRVAHCNDPNCSTKSIARVGEVSDEGWNGGVPMVLDDLGNPVLSYFHRDFNTGSAEFRVLHCGDSNCASGNVTTTVDSAAENGDRSSLRLDSHGNPVVSYRPSGGTPPLLTILHCGDANCSSGNIFVTPDPKKYSGLSSLQLDAAGRPVVSYEGIRGIDPELRLLHCATDTCQ